MDRVTCNYCGREVAIQGKWTMRLRPHNTGPNGYGRRCAGSGKSFGAVPPKEA